VENSLLLRDPRFRQIAIFGRRRDGPLGRLDLAEELALATQQDDALAAAHAGGPRRSNLTATPFPLCRSFNATTPCGYFAMSREAASTAISRRSR
jgi:hypothetical protein